MSDQDENKLFPIFYKPKAVAASKVTKRRKTKKFKTSKDQMLLDAGQKKRITQCFECNHVFCKGNPEDEKWHIDKYHNAEKVLKFTGWKNEHVLVEKKPHFRIIKIAPNDPPVWWKKVKPVIGFINRDMGNYDIELDISNCQIFLCIFKQSIVGVLIAEAQTIGNKLLNENYCSEKSFPIKCGVVKIWVAQKHRRNGLGTILMNCLKKYFLDDGTVLKNEDIAFSSLTDDGTVFASKYFQTDKFLIYF